MVKQGVGELLREWRRRRGLSQEVLAQSAEVSTRHLSCVETGKAQPSAQMLLILSSALEMPLRDRNLLLITAGHAPAYRESDLGAEEMAPIRQVLEQILKHSEPNPVLVADGAYELLTANASMAAIAVWLLGEMPTFNVFGSVFKELKPFIVNWELVGLASINRLRREVLHTGDARLRALYEELKPLAPPADWSPPPVALPVILRKDGLEMSLFTTLTTLGTATDVTTSEIRIETYYPMDEASRVALASIAGR